MTIFTSNEATRGRDRCVNSVGNRIDLVGHTPSLPIDTRHLHPKAFLDGIHRRVLPRIDRRHIAAESPVIRGLLPLRTRRCGIQRDIRRFGLRVIRGAHVLLVDIGTFPALRHRQVMLVL